MNGIRLITLVLGCALFSGCVGIPEVNTNTISTTPASSMTMNIARKAVRACAELPNSTAMFDRFEATGFRSPNAPDFASRTKAAGGEVRVVIPLVSFDDGNVIVQAGIGYCYVGVRGMTPQQSFELAQPLVSRYKAITNAEHGDGLSDHVVQAWRVQPKGVPRVLIAAHKTWPWSRGKWPSVPGAAVTLIAR